MKKLTLLKSMLLLCALIAGSSAWAQTETITLSAQGYSNAQKVSSTAGTVITLTYDKGTSSTDPAYYDTGTGVRVYAGGKMTVSAGGLTLTKVVVTFGKNSSPTISETSNGTTTTGGTSSPATWTGSATEMYFNVSNSGHARIQKIEAWVVVPVTFPASGFASIVSSNILDFSNAITNLDAPYKATAAAAGTGVTLTSMSGIVAASTPMIIKGTASTTANIPVSIAAATADASSNLLSGSATADVPVTANNAYILKGGKFCLVTADSNVPKGKAYLPASNVGAKELTLNFEDENTTGIEKTIANKTMDDQYYNLAGQRVAQPTKGLYIVNGKKVIIK